MKREVQRSCKLPAFEIDLASLGVLHGKIAELFESQGNIHHSIDIEKKNEELSFSGVDEIRTYPELNGRITKFSLWYSQKGRRLRVDCTEFLGSSASASATAETEAWCAGALETVKAFFESHRVWYHWFRSLPFGWLLFGAINMPGAFIWFRIFNKTLTVSSASIAGWILATITVAILYFGKGRLLPAASLIITEEESYWHRKAPEWSLIIALLAAVLTVVGWFVGK